MLKVVFRSLKLGVPVVMRRIALIKAKPKPGHLSGIVSKINSHRTTGASSSISNWCGGQITTYYVDRYGVQHFRPPWYLRWYKNRRNGLLFAVLGALGCSALIKGNIETVPFTNRRQFVFLPRCLERWIGEKLFELMKEEDFLDKILPAEHPTSVRVRLISDNIIDALYKRFDVPRYVKGDQVTNDSRANLKENTSIKQHLEGLKWEVIVVDEPIFNAFCLPGGKIVVYTEMLKHFKKDVEIATIIGHEVAHAVARHSAGEITKDLLLLIPKRFLNVFVAPVLVKMLSFLFLELPYSRRLELEADHIGLLLMALAGYDPRAAPEVYRTFESDEDDEKMEFISTHPCGKKRAEFLSQDNVMNEAMSIYGGLQKETDFHEQYLLRFFKALAQKLKSPKA